MNVQTIDIISASVAILLFFGYVLFWVVLSYRHKRTEEERWRKRLKDVLIAKGEKVNETSLLKESADPQAYLKTNLSKEKLLAQWLQHAGLKMKPMIFLGESIAFGVFVFFLFFISFQKGLLLCLLIGILSGILFPWLLVTYLIKKQRNKFLDEFPVALDMIHRALRAGHSADHALEMVATQATGHIGKVFQQVVDKIHMGESPESVLSETSDRLGIEDFRMLAIVLVLQREMGGGLAEAVENFSNIIRARQNLQKKVKALTGEVRITAIILTCIPFVMGALIYVTSPHYLDSLFYTPRGHILLIFGGLMLSIGITIIFRMAYKEVY
jgi:tight adherence protein B